MKRFDRSSDLIDFVASFVQAIFLCTPSLPGATCSSLNAVGWSRCMFLQISTLALCLKRVIFPDRLMRIDWLVDFVATTLLWYFSPETWTLSLRPVEGHRTGFLGQTWLRKLHTGVAVFRRCVRVTTEAIEIGKLEILCSAWSYAELFGVGLASRLITFGLLVLLLSN